MVLPDCDLVPMDALFDKIALKAQSLGCEALDRLFQKHPETKIHFSNMDLTPGSKDLHTHGGKVVNTIAEAFKHLGNLTDYLSPLRDLHTNKLKLTVPTIKLLCDCLLEVIFKHFPDADRSTFDKFLNDVAVNLISR
ncbi:hemoglobin heart muscle subunit alpha-type-like isoform X1 [Mixophyes fleayi]|uniref:hemoglobin heart muscle subunit alpha-type-like isoform X1 n=1 Tax=Mixophyes fleayi TaxID=3061075 RepID=UPI003F4DD29A